MSATLGEVHPMPLLPTIDLCGTVVTRLICGGNPFSGYSHVSADLDWEMIRYYTMPRLQATLAECWRCGINTVQTRGNRLMMRMILEHRENGGQLHWLAQTASEFRDIKANIAEIRRYQPFAIYHHGTHTDNAWHTGRMEEVREIIRAIKEQGLPAGLGTHIPEVIQYAEDKGWETDFYMACFYNLARGYKSAPATQQDAYQRDRFPEEDPPHMTAVLRQVRKPCLGFKILAASRRCGSPDEVRRAFEFAFDHLKPTDAVVVGVFQRNKNQVAENARFVREILSRGQVLNTGSS